MNNMAFSSHLQNVPGRITASTACPACRASDVGYGTSEKNRVDLHCLDSWTTF